LSVHFWWARLDDRKSIVQIYRPFGLSY
jgi:hypothetical protein